MAEKCHALGYAAIRRGRWAAVLEVLQRSNVPIGSLRGSWRYGDFHLSKDGAHSFSDLDLVVVGLDPVELNSLKQAIEVRLALQLPLRVNIHPVESMDGMTLDDGRLLLIGEYLVSLWHKIPRRLMTEDYLRAKITLLFLRTRISERYVQVARRLGNCVARKAIDAKLASRSSFTLADCMACLTHSSDGIVREFHRECLENKPSNAFLRRWRCRVEQATSVSPWLRDYIVAKVGQQPET